MDELQPWPPYDDEPIQRAVRELGYPSLLALMDAHAGQPYGKVLRILRAHLGYLVSMLQLHKMHMLEAIATRGKRGAAKDSLVRTLREHVSGGWNKGKKAREKRARACAEWVLPRTGGNKSEWDRIDALAKSVWDSLVAMNPPVDWCPSSPADPIVESAFQSGWPATLDGD